MITSWWFISDCGKSYSSSNSASIKIFNQNYHPFWREKCSSSLYFYRYFIFSRIFLFSSFSSTHMSFYKHIWMHLYFLRETNTKERYRTMIERQREARKQFILLDLIFHSRINNQLVFFLLVDFIFIIGHYKFKKFWWTK